MSFSVIIPSKTFGNLVPCVEAVRKHEPEARVIIVDDFDHQRFSEDGRDQDHDDLAALCERHGPAVAVSGIKPFIFSRNVNIGIRAADSDDVVILNDDALLETPGGFTKLAAFAAAQPEGGCVAPAVNVTGQTFQRLENRLPHGYRFVDCVPYVCVFIPRSTLDKIGLLDERYCLDYGMEDRDHCEAMTRSGLNIAVLYDVFVDHGSLQSSFRGDPQQPKSFQKNLALFNRKWGTRL